MPVEKEVVGEDNQLGLGFLSGQAAGPGLLLGEPVLDLVEDLLGLPPPPVQLGDHSGGQVHDVGQELVALAAHRIGVADDAQQVALAGADPAIVLKLPPRVVEPPR